MDKTTQYKNLVGFRYGFNFVITNPIETRVIGGGRREAERTQLREENDRFWSNAGRGQ